MKRVASPLLSVLSIAVLVALGSAAAATSETAQDRLASNSGPWLGIEGEPLAMKTEEEVLEFLRTARVVSSVELRLGINRPLKVTLEKDGVEANAIFRTVDTKKDTVKINGRMYRGFHDSYMYECAAYNLGRVLGLDSIPPCVRRAVRGTDGTMQLWVENAMTEKRRRDDGVHPPEPLEWARQRQTMRLFDALIYNFDRNIGNMLVTPDWKLWFIDHTRSFLMAPKIETPERIIWCERDLWQRLQALDTATLKQHLQPFVDKFQIRGVLKRRDQIVSRLKKRIDELGEDRVIYERGDAGEGLDPDDFVVADADEDLPDRT